MVATAVSIVILTAIAGAVMLKLAAVLVKMVSLKSIPAV